MAAHQNRLAVYRNLRDGLWSLQHQGRVIGHSREIRIKNAELRVGAKGRLRVLREQRKNVHAKIYGYRDYLCLSVDECREITYNPYKHESFVYVDTGEPIYKASRVLFCPDMTVWVTP